MALGRGIALVAIASTLGAACTPRSAPANAAPAGGRTSSSGAKSKPAPGESATRREPRPLLTADAIRSVIVGEIGASVKESRGTFKVTFARDDVAVKIRGRVLRTAAGLTSWAAFAPGKRPGTEAMVMGDFVVFEDEIAPVLRAALDGGLEVTALHNHFVAADPPVMFMHIGGEGTYRDLARAVARSFEATRAVRKSKPRPEVANSAGLIAANDLVDRAPLEAVFDRQAQPGTVPKFVFGREVRMDCGCTVDERMGVASWAAFSGSNELALVDGDLALTAEELQPALRALLMGGLDVVAIHNHMTNEEPRLFFVHFLGQAPALTLAKAVQAALPHAKQPLENSN